MADLFETARLHSAFLCLATPIIGAAVAAASPSARLSWIVALVAAGASATFGADLAWRVLAAGGTPSTPVEGVQFALDGVGAFMAALLSACCWLAACAGGSSLRETHGRGMPWGFALMLLSLAGWIGAMLAHGLITMLISVELAWISAIGLLCLHGERERAALSGALRMLSAGAVGSALCLFGAALVFQSFGSLSLQDIAVAPAERPAMSALGFGALIVGLAFKIGAVPLHGWTPAALGPANGLSALVLGVLGMAGALGVTTRLASYAAALPATGEGLSTALAMLGGVSIVVGSLQAIGARNLRRLAAYALIAQAGGVLICIALGSPAGFAAALVQIVAMSAAGLALYGAAASAGVGALHALDGLSRRAPFVAAAMTFGAISLIGAPLTIGFLGRWRLIEAGVGAGWWWAVGAMTFASLAAVFYAGRLIERVYFRRAHSTARETRNPWRFAFYPALIAAIVVIVSGVSPGVLLRAADAAAASLGGGA